MAARKQPQSGAESVRIVKRIRQDIRHSHASGYNFDNDIVAVIHLRLPFQPLQYIFNRVAARRRQTRQIADKSFGPICTNVPFRKLHPSYRMDRDLSLYVTSSHNYHPLMVIYARDGIFSTAI